MSEATNTTQTQTTQTANQSAGQSESGATNSSETQKSLQSDTLKTSTQTNQSQPAETTKVQIEEVRNAQASSTFNSFASDGSGKEKFNFDSIIPQDQKDKEWVKNISKSEDPVSELFKKVDNLQSAIGKNVPIPGDDSTPEQRKNFYKAIGVPENIKGYEVNPVEWAPEDKPVADKLKEFKPEPLMNELKTAAMEAGITKAAWEKLEQTWDKATVQQLKANAAAGKQQDVDFDQQMTKMYGEEKMAVMDRGSKLLSQFVRPEHKGIMAKLPNDALAAFAGALSDIYKATTKEDTFNTGTGNTTTTANTGVTSRQELLSMLQKRDSIKNTMSPQYEELTKRINAAYKSLPPDALKQPLSMV
jgi:hypothetical protein